VVLNPDVMPKLRINDLYAQAVRGQRNGGGGMSARLQEARWFMKNIQQRFDTILRVSKAIVERQKNFFTHGAIAMKPLVLREIADELGLHESTISRVTTAKYMATPHGTFELKYFFGSSLNTEAGGNASSTAVRALIQQLVAPKTRPSRCRTASSADARGAGHPGRAAHGGQVPRGAEDRAGLAAQGI
jgi:RNA polymerase sigma-54 factor